MSRPRFHLEQPATVKLRRSLAADPFREHYEGVGAQGTTQELELLNEVGSTLLQLRERRQVSTYDVHDLTCHFRRAVSRSEG